MQNGDNKNRKSRYARPPYSDRPNRPSSNNARAEPTNPNNAQKHYERYLNLAQTEAQNGNTIGAENYYQYAEHYFRMIPRAE